MWQLSASHVRCSAFLTLQSRQPSCRYVVVSDYRCLCGFTYLCEGMCARTAMSTQTLKCPLLGVCDMRGRSLDGARARKNGVAVKGIVRVYRCELVFKCIWAQVVCIVGRMALCVLTECVGARCSGAVRAVLRSTYRIPTGNTEDLDTGRRNTHTHTHMYARIE